jgi:molecular chaperone GrpE
MGRGGVDGLKTGHTEAAGYGIVLSAKEADRRLILVINGLSSMKEREREGAYLLNWGFRNFENYRKRAAVQLTDEVDRSTGRIVEAMLPVLDACEAAVAHGVEGVENIWSSLLGTLQKSGLEALDLQGQPFDPALAEAVLHEEGDGGEAVVVEVLRTGYRWKGRVLRAAMVKVKG